MPKFTDFPTARAASEGLRQVDTADAQAAYDAATDGKGDPDGDTYTAMMARVAQAEQRHRDRVAAAAAEFGVRTDVRGDPAAAHAVLWLMFGFEPATPNA